ncbi:MAG TPA: cupin domain-containing protein [Streptosporangiaceae bacterium]|nr:cupin domain-containing protein [Streptosporangiaceae bacterium]
MARPFIEFLHEQALPWDRGLYGGGRPDVEVKMLSLDDETGASTTLVRYPPGWHRDKPEHLLADEEFFVLAGSLTIGEQAYHELSYAFLPSGFLRPRAASAEGALVLAFYESEPRAAGGAASAGMDESRLVRHIDALAGEWGGNFHPQFPPGAGRKFLRQDPHDGEQTWILGTMPLRFGRRPEKHPVVEEMFLLSGELVGPLGAMHAGCYFWRPPEEWHGPFGSKTGNVMLFRTKGGPLSTVYTEDEVEFCWHPEHNPTLPESVAEAARQPYHGRPPL